MVRFSRISFCDQLNVHFGFLYSGFTKGKVSSIIRVAWIVYYNFHSVFISGRISGVLKTADRCAELFYCTTGSEEIVEETERSEGHFGGPFWYS